MKKLILSLAVIVAFGLYSMHARSEQLESAVIAPKSNPTSIPTSTSILTTPSTSDTSVIPTVPVTDTPSVKQGKYKDGSYTGKTYDVFYGNLQVQAVVQNGQLSDVQILQYPNDRGQSVEINRQALPMLIQEAIQAQSAQVNIISGASDSSQGFIQSLDSALSQAI